MTPERRLTVGWKVATLASSIASVRYRALLPMIALEGEGIHSRLFCSGFESNLDGLDVLVIVKSFTADDLVLAQTAMRRGMRVLFDLCDNIFIETYTGENGRAPVQMFQAMADSLHAVIVTTQPLAEVVRGQVPNLEVHVIPDGIETPALRRRMGVVLQAAKALEQGHRVRMLRRKFGNVLHRIRNEGVGLLPLLATHVARRVAKVGWRKLPAFLKGRSPAVRIPPGATPQAEVVAPEVANASRVIVWFGNHGAQHARFGMLDLLEIKGALEAVANEFDVELVVISNHRGKYEKFVAPMAIRSRYVEWSPNAVDHWLRLATVVVIPNTLDPFSLCKSANRTVLAVTRGVPVVATRTPALEPLANHVHFGDALTGLRRYLSSPETGRADAAAASKVAEAVFGQPAIARAWLGALRGVSTARAPAWGHDPECIVVIHLVQDLDLALPILEVWQRDGIKAQAWCSAGLIEKSPRVLASLVHAGIAYRVLPNELPGGSVSFPQSAKVLLTIAETNLGPHKFPRKLTDLALAKGLRVATLQHGFENVGLTYDDSVHAIDRITIKADRIYIWGGLETLHPRVSESIRTRCVPAGCPKPAFVEPADLSHVLPRVEHVVGIFENLHWTRYDDDYRAAFLDGVRALCAEFPQVCFLVKPHHAGLWLTHRFTGQRPDATNLVIADPQSQAWERFTAAQLLGRVSAVITTPSTVALDAARRGLPVAIFASSLDLGNYQPLALLRTPSEWSGFVREALDTRASLALAQASARFVDRVLVPGDGAERIAADLTSFAGVELANVEQSSSGDSIHPRADRHAHSRAAPDGAQWTARSDAIRVYVGADRSQQLATRVLEHSIRRHTTAAVELFPMVDLDIPTPRDPRQRQRTGFSFSRFCIPKLAGYQGRAIYMDADMLVFCDVRNLWNLPFSGHKILVQQDVKHTDVTLAKRNAPAKRSKQCAVMLLDCGRLDWDIDEIVRQLDRASYTYEQLVHEMCLLPEEDIGYTVPFAWNSLEHYDDDTCLIHYTDMGTQPWVSTANPNGSLWIAELRMMIETGALSVAELKTEIDAGHFRPSLLRDLNWRHRLPRVLLPWFDGINARMDRVCGYVPHRAVYEAKRARLDAIHESDARPAVQIQGRRAIERVQ